MTIDNIGGMPAPFDLIATFSDDSAEKFHQTPAVWRANQKTTSVSIKSKKKIKSLKIDGGIWMDADEKNNTWEMK